MAGEIDEAYTLPIMTVSESETIEVLREMIRVAEKRKDEEFTMLERINQYNLALMAFVGGFLSLLLTADLAIEILQSAGFLLLCSICFSLWAIRPRIIKGALIIEDDISALKNKKDISLYSYLLDEAELVERIGNAASALVIQKRWATILAGIFLVLSLCLTYTMHSYGFYA